MIENLKDCFFALNSFRFQNETKIDFYIVLLFLITKKRLLFYPIPILDFKKKMKKISYDLKKSVRSSKRLLKKLTHPYLQVLYVSYVNHV